MTITNSETGQTPRRRAGGRAGHERHVLPQQRPSTQPRIRIRPTEIVSADELESIHLASLRVLEEIGMDFLDAGARDLLKAAGASVDADSQRVRFAPELVTERIRTAPSTFVLHSWNPANPDRGYCDPGFAYHGNAGECAIDEGYGRWSSCYGLR